MPSHLSVAKRTSKSIWLFAGLLSALTLPAMGQATAVSRTAPPLSQPGGLALPATGSQMALQLAVSINNQPAREIGSFTQDPQGGLEAKVKELHDVGIKVPAGIPVQADGAVRLADIAGLACTYDAPNQALACRVPLHLLVTQVFNNQSFGATMAATTKNYGAALNYQLFGSASSTKTFGGYNFNGASVSLDARLFSPFGTFSQTGILGTTTSSPLTALRLDSDFTFSDPASMNVAKLGDTISSGLPWTRPIRMGGAQFQRNFALRPDLITLPLPSYSGSAVVPSTVDVYVNNIRTLSQPVGVGPYQLNNLPLVGEAGTARVVLQDATGRKTEQDLPFFTNSRFLRPGLWDYSAEAGFARQFYGVQSNQYDRRPVFSGSVRRGMTDWLTLEGHAEGGVGLINASAGGDIKLFNRAALTLAVAGSHVRAGTGAQTYVAFETRMLGIGLSLSSQRTFGRYNDLASVTAAPGENPQGTYVTDASSSLSGYAVPLSLAPPKALDRISISLPVSFDHATSVSASLTHQDSDSTGRSTIASLSLSRNLPFHASAFAMVYHDFDNRLGSGMFFGINMPIGMHISTGSAYSWTPNGWNTTASAVRSLGPKIGDYGWQVQASRANTQLSYATASGSYRTRYGELDGSVEQVGTSSDGSLAFGGAISTLDGGVFLSPRIDDSFAVVQAGAPGVSVLYEHQKIGTTDAAGHLLIPTLRSYQTNHIAIDPRGLPLNAVAATTRDVVAPADRSGVVVDFRVNTHVDGAVVILKGVDGQFLKVGTPVHLQGQSKEAVVGYDGRAFITGLHPHNEVKAELDQATCAASFSYQPVPGQQVTIGPLVCQ